jgi:hypothetical protein
MFTSEDPIILAADLSRMTVDPVSTERAEQILSEQMAWLPQGEPLQTVVEDRSWDQQGEGGAYRLHRRTILFRRPEDRLQIMVEVACLDQHGIEMERRRFEEPSGELERYIDQTRSGSSADQT